MKQAGFTLVESLVALLLLSLILVSIASLITAGIFVHREAEDLTAATTIAEEKVEELASLGFLGLDAGGSVDADVDGYFDSVDLDGDGVIDFARRWRVEEFATSKRIVVRTTAADVVVGERKDVTLVSLVSRP